MWLIGSRIEHSSPLTRLHYYSDLTQFDANPSSADHTERACLLFVSSRFHKRPACCYNCHFYFLFGATLFSCWRSQHKPKAAASLSAIASFVHSQGQLHLPLFFFFFIFLQSPSTKKIQYKQTIFQRDYFGLALGGHLMTITVKQFNANVRTGEDWDMKKEWRFRSQRKERGLFPTLAVESPYSCEMSIPQMGRK